MKFLYGLIVGFLVCYFAIKNIHHSVKISTTKDSIEENTTAEPVTKATQVHRAGKMNLPHETLIKNQPEISLQAKMEMVDKMPAETFEKKTKIQFSLQDIMTMESQWPDLHHQIQVIKEARGWRVKKLAPYTVFASTGLTEGNLITYDSIRALGDEGSSSLPYRISTILNHVSIQ